MSGKDSDYRKKSEELTIANKKLDVQNEEKEKRAAELILANKELAFQNEEKEKRATELIIANKELIYQNEEKEKRAAELIIANKELVFQNEEKEKRAAELIIANKELAFQNEEKEKRAAELIIANKELAFQNEEKEKRAAELIIANKELIYQNEEKEKRAEELTVAQERLNHANEELGNFIYRSSHDLRGPVATLLGLGYLAKQEVKEEKALEYIYSIDLVSQKLNTTISKLIKIMFLRTNKLDIETVEMNDLLEEVIDSFKYNEGYERIKINILNLQTRSILTDREVISGILSDLIDNAIRYQNTTLSNPEINVKIISEENNTVIEITDNGIGIPDIAKGKIFEMFYRGTDKSEGAGLGLYMVKNAIDKINGTIELTSLEGIGTTFKIRLPN